MKMLLLCVAFLFWNCEQLSYKPEETAVTFKGIKGVSRTGTGTYLVEWYSLADNEAPRVDKFEIYVQEIVSEGSEASETAAPSEEPVALYSLTKTEDADAIDPVRDSGILMSIDDTQSPVSLGKIINLVEKNSLSYEISDLEPGNYAFQVKALDQKGNRDPNTQVLLLKILPSVRFAGLVAAEFVEGEILLTWDSFEERNGQPFYTVYEGNTFNKPVEIVFENLARIPTHDKLPGSEWTYGVRVTNSKGAEDFNTVVKTVKIPEDQSEYFGCVDGTALGASRVELQFEWPFRGAERVNIYRNGAQVFTTTDQSTTRFFDIGLLEGQNYEYSCEAIVLESSKFGTRKVTVATLSSNPPTFSGIAGAAVKSPNSAQVEWGVATGVPSNRYLIYASVGNNVKWNEKAMAESGPSELSKIIEGLGDELTYALGVRACSANDVCDQNTKVIKITLPDGGAPKTVGASEARVENGELFVTAPWKPTDGGIAKRKLYIKIGENPGTSLSEYTLVKTVVVENINDPPTEINYANLQENKKYNLVVIDEDPSLNVSPNFNVVTIESGDLSPPEFTGISGLTIGDSGLQETTLISSFTAVDSQQVNIAGASHYQVYIKVGGGNACEEGTLHKEFAANIYTAGTAYQYVVQNLAPRTYYTVCLKARDAAGNVSNTSSYLGKSTLDTTPPNFDGLQNLTYSKETGRFTTVWNPSASSDILEYRVRIWKNAASPSAELILELKKGHLSSAGGFPFGPETFPFGSNNVVYVLVDACDDAGFIQGGTQNCTSLPMASALNVTLEDIDPPPGFLGIDAEGAQQTPSEGVIIAKWLAPADWSDYRGFKIYFVDQVTEALNFVKDCPCTQAGCPLQPLTCEVNGLDTYRTYYMHVRAYDSNQNITILDPVSKTTPKRTVDNTSPTFSSNFSLDFIEGKSRLEWSAATDNQYAQEPGAVIRYEIYRKEDATFVNALTPDTDLSAMLLTTVQGSMHEDSQGYVSGKTYYYAICAKDASNNRRCDGNIKSVEVPDIVPPVITNLASNKTLESKTWKLSWLMSDNKTNAADLLVKVRRLISPLSTDKASLGSPTISTSLGALELDGLTGPQNEDSYVHYMVTIEDEAGNQTDSFISIYSTNKIEIAEVLPNEGLLIGNKFLVLYGSGFHSSTEVSIGSLPCDDVTVISNEVLHCLTPEQTLQGDYDVEVTNSDGSSDRALEGYSYCDGASCVNICNRPSDWGPTFAAGNGTQVNPWILCTGTQLSATRSAGNTRYYLLGDNIDLASFTGNSFAPMATDGTYYYSHIDGDGHIIANYTYKSAGTSFVGLIRRLGPDRTIKDLGLVNVDVEGLTHVGALIGYADYSTGSTLDHIFTTGTVKGNDEYVGGIVGHGALNIYNSYSRANVTGRMRVGGIAGAKWYGLANLTSYGNITATGKSDHCHVGGLFGHVDGGGGSTSNLFNYGNVTCLDDNANNYQLHTGGLTGGTANLSISDSASYGTVNGWDYVGGAFAYISGGTIDNVYATGDTTGQRSIVGGLIGHTNGTSLIKNSYATGNVIGYRHVGGLIGYGTGDVTSCYAKGAVSITTPAGDYDHGGLIGYYSGNQKSVYKSYATGTVTGKSYAGGLIGRWDHGWIKESYATNIINSTGSDVGGLVGHAGDANYGTEDSYATGTVTGINSVGGFIGRYRANAVDPSYHIKRSYSTATVNGQRYIGGFFGFVYPSANLLTATTSYASGSVTGLEEVGGFVGRLHGDHATNKINLKKVYATGNVTGTTWVGGFGGRLYYRNVFISEAFASGAVEGASTVGGFLGYNPYRYTAVELNEISDSYALGSVKGNDLIGGFCGECSNVMRRIYSTGKVERKISGSGIIGGLIGRIVNNGSFSGFPDSFWNVTTSGQPSSSGGGEGKSQTDMQTQATFTNYDFSDVWKIEPNQYPKFKWQ
jgi:hypothetical protein